MIYNETDELWYGLNSERLASPIGKFAPSDKYYEYDTKMGYITDGLVWYQGGTLQNSIVGSLAKGPDNNDFIIEGTNCKGKSASKPLASAYLFYTYWSVDTDPHADAIEVSDGTNWVVV